MAKINILNSNVYNKISAGEVVEKPASVVKELVENALDAGATQISVEIAEGGLSFIRVSDNGCGIEKEELNKVFLPHATSKIIKASDLESIHSLGFRGEAMASIASVSSAEISSCVSGADGFVLECVGGEIGSISACPREVGTAVTVKNLFFNTPARLKFMRKPKTEEHDITSLMQRLAFANPFVRFEYSNEDGTILSTSGENLLEVMADVYGDDIIDKTLEINAEEYGMRLVGFISNTSNSKPTRAYQTFIVNGRLVTNLAMITALNNAYSDYYVKRCYPLAVLDLTVNPTEIDVNVHPTKTEIRFEYQSKVFSFLQRNIRKCLENSLKSKVVVLGEMGGVISDEWTKPFTPDEPTNHESSTSIDLASLPKINFVRDKGYLSDTDISGVGAIIERGENRLDIASLYDDTKTKHKKKDSTTQKSNTKSAPEGKDNKCGAQAEQQAIVCSKKEVNTKPEREDDINILPITNQSCEEKGNKKCKQNPIQQNIEAVEDKKGLDYRIVGQLFGTYIILERKDEFLVIDQHAACEFTLYRRLCKQMENNSLIVQPLLLPFDFSADFKSADELASKIEQLCAIGIEIERMGDCNFRLLSLPDIISSVDYNALVACLLSDEPSDTEIKERLMYSACHAAIKGNTFLDDEAISIFLNSVFKEGVFPKCPHGRPAYIKYTRKDLEKLFMRIV